MKRFYRNPAQTLYGYLQYFYPTARTKILYATDIPKLYRFEALSPTEQGLILQFETFPQEQQINTPLAPEVFGFLLEIVSGVTLESRILCSEGFHRLSAWDIFPFLRTEYPEEPLRGLIHAFYNRSYALLHPGQDPKPYAAPREWGYWTAEECQQATVLLKPLLQKDRPEHLRFEERARASTFKNGAGQEIDTSYLSRIQKKERARNHFVALRFSLSYLLDVLDQRRPEEGLVSF